MTLANLAAMSLVDEPPRGEDGFGRWRRGLHRKQLEEKERLRELGKVQAPL
jgi:hypothetical protein